MKRMLVISDLHSGHQAGLTPPRWHVHEGTDSGRTKRNKLALLQRESWSWYVKTVSANGPYDAIVCNGDAIDGRGERSGGTELITGDREEQCEMAMQCIQRAMPAKRKDCKLLMTYGTGYHTGDMEDWENQIAKDLNAEKIGSHEWVDLGGVVFDFKHHIGSSGVPHGRHTAVTREAVWSQLWSDRGLTPKADVLVRSHVHYHAFCGCNSLKPSLRMTTPALQAMGTKFGSRRRSGLVDFGVIIFEVVRGQLTWKPLFANLKTQVAEAVKV